MKIPTITIQQLLEAGVHLGHKTLRWNPKMKRYIFGKRDSIHIIDLTQTLELINVALEKIFQINDPVDTLILDEIDSGISGETAEKVAEQLVQISKIKQVICITHLSQIMKRADQHLYVKKLVKENETEVYFNYLTKLEREKVIKNTFE